MEGTGWTEVVTLRTSPWLNSCRFRPSKDTQAEFRASGLSITFSSTPAGTGRRKGEMLFLILLFLLLLLIRPHSTNLTACLYSYLNPELHRTWDWSERQRVRADGGDENWGNRGMNHRRPRGQGIGSASRRCRNDQTVSLYGGIYISYQKCLTAKWIKEITKTRPDQTGHSRYILLLE